RGALVEAADQVEEELAAGLGEGQIAELVEHDEVEPGQVIGQPPLAAGTGLALQAVDEVDDGVEAPSGAATDAGAGDRDSEMAFAGAGATHQHGVALLGEEAAGGELADQGLVDRRAGEVELVEVFGQRQLGDG